MSDFWYYNELDSVDGHNSESVLQEAEPETSQPQEADDDFFIDTCSTAFIDGSLVSALIRSCANRAR